jgi:hypothetical protein
MGGDMRRAAPLCALILMTILAAGCTSRPTHAADSSSAGGRSANRVSPQAIGQASGSGRAQLDTLNVSVPSVSTSVSISAGAAVGAKARAQIQELAVRLGAHVSDPVHIGIDGNLSARGATLTRTYPQPLVVGAVAAFAYYDDAIDGWHVIPSTLSTDRRTLIATVHHFSDWTDWWTSAQDQASFDVMNALDKRVTAPTCDVPPPAWVDGAPVFADGKNLPLRWCAGHDPANPDWLVVKVRVNRSYGDVIRTSTTPQWTWNSYTQRGLAAEAAAALLNLPDAILELATSRLNEGAELPGGFELNFGFTEDQVRNAPDGGTALVSGMQPDPTELVWSLALDSLKDVLPKPEAYALATLAAAHCSQVITEASGDPSAMAAAATGCILDGQDAIKNHYQQYLLKTVTGLTPVDAAALSDKAVGKLRFVVAAGLLYKLAYFIGDLQLPDDGYSLSVSSIVRTRPARVFVPATTSPYSTGVLTGLSVKVGERVHLSATGQAKYGREISPCAGNPSTDPDGRRWLPQTSCPRKLDSRAPVPTAPIGALIIRIAGGRWTFAGRSSTFAATATGRIYLGYNDFKVDDNTNGYYVNLGLDK